jgi:hypothetical protein
MRVRGVVCPDKVDVQKTFATAWKLYTAVTLLCGSCTGMDHWPRTTKTAKHEYEDGWEEAMTRVHRTIQPCGTNADAAVHMAADFKHAVNVPGCEGAFSPSPDPNVRGTLRSLQGN